MQPEQHVVPVVRVEKPRAVCFVEGVLRVQRSVRAFRGVSRTVTNTNSGNRKARRVKLLLFVILRTAFRRFVLALVLFGFLLCAASAARAFALLRHNNEVAFIIRVVVRIRVLGFDVVVVLVPRLVAVLVVARGLFLFPVLRL